jgi:hypothetical protein
VVNVVVPTLELIAGQLLVKPDRSEARNLMHWRQNFALVSEWRPALFVCPPRIEDNPGSFV